MSGSDVTVLALAVAAGSAAIAYWIGYARGHARGYEACSLAWGTFLEEHAAGTPEATLASIDLAAAPQSPGPGGARA